MASRTRHQPPVLLWVVDAASAATRSDLGAVRDSALGIHGELRMEVVTTGTSADSLAAGRAVLALLASGEIYPVRAVEDVCRAHHDDGADLADPAVVAGLAARRGHDAEAVEALVASAALDDMVKEDRETAALLGDPEDHSLFLLGDHDVTRLPPPSAGAREILAALRRLA